MARKKQVKRSLEEIVETFVRASGLRKRELERLRVRDFFQGHHDFWYETHWIKVAAFEDIPAHEVPIALNSEWIVAEVCRNRGPDDLVFPELPATLDYEHLREDYADDLFLFYFESLGRTGAPNSVSGLGQHLKQALGLRHYDEKRRRVMRQASRDIRRMVGLR